MRNTNTTLRELSHKYATILRKCAILNAIVLGVIVATPSNATIVTGTGMINFKYNF